MTFPRGSSSPAPGRAQRCQQRVGEDWIPSLVSPPPTSLLPCTLPAEYCTLFKKENVIERSAKCSPVLLLLLCFSVVTAPPIQSKLYIGSSQQTFCSAAKGDRLVPCLCVLRQKWGATGYRPQPQPGLTFFGVRGELWVKDPLSQHWFNTVKCQSCRVTVWYLQGVRVDMWAVLHRQNAVNKYTSFSYSSTGVWHLTLDTGFPTPHALLYAFPSLGENNNTVLLPVLPIARSSQWWEALGSISQVVPNCTVSKPARNSTVSSL